MTKVHKIKRNHSNLTCLNVNVTKYVIKISKQYTEFCIVYLHNIILSKLLRSYSSRDVKCIKFDIVKDIRKTIKMMA